MTHRQPFVLESSEELCSNCSLTLPSAPALDREPGAPPAPRGLRQRREGQVGETFRRQAPRLAGELVHFEGQLLVPAEGAMKSAFSDPPI